MDTFRLLFIGDIVGSEAVTAVERLVPGLRMELELDAVISNGENSAPSERGITAESGEALLSAVDFLTLGDHTFDEEDIGLFLDQEQRVVRPANRKEEGDDGVARNIKYGAQPRAKAEGTTVLHTKRSGGRLSILRAPWLGS